MILSKKHSKTKAYRFKLFLLMNLVKLAHLHYYRVILRKTKRNFMLAFQKRPKFFSSKIFFTIFFKLLMNFR